MEGPFVASDAGGLWQTRLSRCKNRDERADGLEERSDERNLEDKRWWAENCARASGSLLQKRWSKPSVAEIRAAVSASVATPSGFPFGSEDMMVV